MTVKERFDVLIKHFASGNKREFSKKIGVSPTVVENIVGARRGNPSFEVLQKILYAFADINASWLITGNGTMFRHENRQSAPPAMQNDEYKNKYIEQLEEIIRLKDEIASLKEEKEN